MSDIVERLRKWTFRTSQQNDSDAADAAAEIERLRAENFHLAACQCKTSIPQENGDWKCAEIERLRAALREIRRELERTDVGWDHPTLEDFDIEKVWRIARAALEVKE